MVGFALPSGDSDSAVTMVSLSSSCLSSGRIRATTRTDIVEVVEVVVGGRVGAAKGEFTEVNRENNDSPTLTSKARSAMGHPG
jgi:hypothetical protein